MVGTVQLVEAGVGFCYEAVAEGRQAQLGHRAVVQDLGADVHVLNGFLCSCCNKRVASHVAGRSSRIQEAQSYQKPMCWTDYVGRFSGCSTSQAFATSCPLITLYNLNPAKQI